MESFRIGGEKKTSKGNALEIKLNKENWNKTKTKQIKLKCILKQ